MAVNDKYLVTIQYTSGLFTGHAFNVLAFNTVKQPETITNQQAVQQLLANMGSLLSARLKPLLPTQVVISGLRAIGLTDPTFQEDDAVNITGAATGGFVSSRAAVVVSLLTGLRGRSYRGRMFIPTPTDVSAENGRLTATAATAYAAVVRSLLTENVPNASGFEMGVYSRKLSKDQGTPVVTKITDIAVRTVLGSIRGRVRVT